MRQDTLYTLFDLGFGYSKLVSAAAALSLLHVVKLHFDVLESVFLAVSLTFLYNMMGELYT